MPNLRTTDETTRSPVDGTELVRLATAGANWKATLASMGLAGLTAGSILFASATGNITQDNATFYWNDTNNRISIGGKSLSESSWGFQAALTVHVTSDWVGTFARWVNNSNAPDFTFAKSRGASVGTHAIVQNADLLGSLWFAGDDGASFQPAAAIRSYVNGVPGVGDMPGALSFETTPDGSATTVQRMFIDSAGGILFAAESKIGIGSLPSLTGFFASSANAFQPQNIVENTTVDANSGYSIIQKSRNFADVTNGDALGTFIFRGYASGGYNNAAYLSAVVEGAPVGANVPAQFQLCTFDNAGAGHITTIHPSGNIEVASGAVLFLGNFNGAVGGGSGNAVEVWGDAANEGSLTLGMFNASAATASRLEFYRSKNATIGSATVVAVGDVLGEIYFYGAQQTGTFSNSVAAAKIQCQVDGTVTSGAGADMPGALYFYTTGDASGTPTARMVITSAGNVAIANTGFGFAIGGNSPQLMSSGIDAASGGVGIGMFSATASTGPHLDFYRSKDATLGTATVVASGDVLGEIYFYGAQQTGTRSNQNAGAKIQAAVDGTVTSGAGADMPGRIVFFTTPDGSGTLTERVRIDSVGTTTFTPSSPSTATGVDSFGVVTTGSFGGGIGMIDGTGNIALYSTNSGVTFNIGFATSLGAIASWWQLDSSGVLSMAQSQSLIFKISTTEVGRFDTSSRFILGGTATLSVGGNANQLQNWGTTVATGGLSLGMFNATAGTCAHIDFYRSDNATLGSATVVASGDALGSITWYGAQQTGTFATQNPAAQIIAEVDGTVTSGAGADMPGRVRILTTPDASGTVTEALRITKDQQISTRGALRTVAGTSSYFQVNASGGGIVTESLLLWEVSANGPSLSLGKSRNNTVGSHTIVTSGDNLGAVNFLGSNGSDFDYAAQIQCFSDGTPGASNDMPGRLGFYTSADASATPTERLRIDNAGQCFFPSVTTTAGGGSAARLDNATTPANKLLRDTSSLRFKTAIEDVPTKRLNAALDMRVIEFASLCAVDDPEVRFVGLGAEDVAEVDPALVAWGRDYDSGPLLPMGVQYERVNLLRTEALKLRCAMLEEKIKQLEERLS